MNDQPIIAKSIFTIIIGSVFGLWLYVILASLLGIITEPFWWGGKGWFLPMLGTFVMVVGSVPLCFIAKLFFKHSEPLPNVRHLLSVGFFHGLLFLVALQMTTYLIGMMVGLVAFQFSAVIEVSIAFLKAGTAFLVSGILSMLIVIWFMNRKSGHTTNNAAL